VDRLAAGNADLGQRRGDGARQVAVADRAGAQRNLGVDAVLASWPPAVQTLTPWTLTPATVSARSTAWAIAWAASSRLTIAPPRTPRDWT
jgi:hypothetical protein